MSKVKDIFIEIKCNFYGMFFIPISFISAFLMILQLASIQQPNSCGIKLTFNAEFKTDELVFLDAHYRKK